MKNANKSKGTKHCAEFTIIGTVIKIYHGKTADYATVKVQPDPEDYYDTFRVALPKEYGIEENDTCTFTGTITTFFDREKKAQQINFNATTCTPL